MQSKKVQHVFLVGAKLTSIYIATCRIGIFIKCFYKRIHKLGGKIYLNPDGNKILYG